MKEIKEEKKELTVEEQVKESLKYLNLNNIELGENYTAKTTRGDYRFTMKAPKLEDDYKIIAELHNLKKELGVENTPLAPMDEMPLRILATLNYVITKIEKKKQAEVEDEISYTTLEDDFIEIFRKKVNVTSIYSKIVFPLYMDFINFKTSVDFSVEDIKKN